MIKVRSVSWLIEFSSQLLQIEIQIQHPKNPVTRRGVGWYDVAALPMNCEIIERIVSIDPIFKNHRLPTAPYKHVQIEIKLKILVTVWLISFSSKLQLIVN